MLDTTAIQCPFDSEMSCDIDGVYTLRSLGITDEGEDAICLLTVTLHQVSPLAIICVKY